jgi:hypothetical protein
MKPKPHFEQPRGLVLNPWLRSCEFSRLPQFGQMKTGIAPRMDEFDFGIHAISP